MIPVTYRAGVSYLLRHPWQLALAFLGVGIGVAVIVAVDLANASAGKAFRLSMDKVAGEATHQIVGGPRGIQEDVYTQLRVSHGIRSIAPVVSGSVEINDQTVSVLGVDLFAEQAMRTFTSQATTPTGADGVPEQNIFEAFLTEPGTATLSRKTAAELNLNVGEPFTILAAGIEHTATLLGVYDGNQGALDNLLITDIGTAQEWLGQTGWLSRIDARIAEGDSGALARLEAALPDNVRVLTAAGRTQATAAMSQAFTTNLTAMSLLALLVGLFLIFNSVSFSVLQRREFIATLRALGITRRQVFGMILTEAALLGVIASVLGVVLGLWLGELLLELVARSINDLYFRVNVTQVSVSAISIIKGLTAGVLAAIVAAAAPAIDATGYEPRQTMLRSSLEGRAGRAVPRVAAAGLITTLMAVAILILSGRNLVAGLAAVFLLIIGFACCVPLVVRRAATLMAPAAQAVGGTVSRMAVSGIATSLSRTAVAIVALAIAVSATIGVSIMVDSFRVSVQSWLEQTLRADIYAGVERGAMQPELIVDISTLDGIVEVSTSRRTTLEDTSGRTQLIAIRMAPGGYAGTELLDGTPDTVWPAWETEDAVLVSEPYAYHNEVEPGDTITLSTRDGDRAFVVAARYKSFDVNASTVMMSRANYDRYFDDDGIDTLGLYLADNTNVDRIIGQIETLSDGRQRLRVDSNARIRELSLEIFDQTFIITDVLYWLATGVAFIGILGAMLALQLERAREFALLRALGMTPGQIGRMITTQTGMIGVLSGLAAIPLGVVMAWVLIKVINRRAFGWQIDMSVTPDIPGSALLFAITASVLAGLYPAWRAAQSQPATVMREE